MFSLWIHSLPPEWLLRIMIKFFIAIMFLPTLALANPSFFREEWQCSAEGYDKNQLLQQVYGFGPSRLLAKDQAMQRCQSEKGYRSCQIKNCFLRNPNQ